jgi:hypothetical protein
MVSDKALRDFAYRALISEISELSPGTTPAEIRFFVEQMTHGQLTGIYFMMFETGMVE